MTYVFDNPDKSTVVSTRITLTVHGTIAIRLTRTGTTASTEFTELAMGAATALGYVSPPRRRVARKRDGPRTPAESAGSETENRIPNLSR